MTAEQKRRAEPMLKVMGETYRKASLEWRPLHRKALDDMSAELRELVKPIYDAIDNE